MASKIEASYFRVRGFQDAYRRRERATLRWLEARLDARCYVSFSAGKDSMVVASLCAMLRPDIPVLMVDPGVPVHWTEEDRANILEFTQVAGWNLARFAWDKFANTRTLAADNEREYRHAVHADMFSELTTYADANNLTRRITGMRAEESNARRKFLVSARGQTENTLQPIWDWTAEDVWTYIIARGLPWLSIYDHLGPNARNGLIGKNGREHGRLVYLKRYYPEAFQRACELFGARKYV